MAGEIMDSAADILFSYLRDVIYEPASALLDTSELPEDFQDFASGLQYFAECVMETKELAWALSKGNLAGKLPSRGNEIAAPLKSLHAAIKHLSWQTQQIAQGDYSQRVDFMGDFSNAFNMMVEQLAEREQALEDKIKQIEQKTTSLEQGNLLLTALMHYVPQQIIVMDVVSREILLMNDIAAAEIKNDAGYINNILELVSHRRSELGSGAEIDISYKQDGVERYFIIKSYQLEWHDSNAEVFAISDISATKSQIKELEIQAYHDNATQLYNRTFGMLTLDSWLREKKKFSLIFADLDSLKYINDEYGHNEGDMYIINAAKALKRFSHDAVVCRIGGDEFMLLAPGVGYDEAHERMGDIYENFKRDEYLKDKNYSYSISFGVAAVEEENKLQASDVLSLADERMYENKRANKKARQK